MVFQVEFLVRITLLLRGAANSTATTNLTTNLHPWFITGFSDEGSFMLSLSENNRYNSGWAITLRFRIVLHIRDTALLEQIHKYFGVGKVRVGSEAGISFESIKELEVIFNHFDRYPLITQKWSDYQLFRQAFNLVKNKNHLTEEGGKTACSNKSLNE